MVDVGTGVERELGISKERLDQALYGLEREGYVVWKGGIPQATNPGQQTNQKVLCVPGTPHKDIYKFDEVKQSKIIFLVMVEKHMRRNSIIQKV